MTDPITPHATELKYNSLYVLLWHYRSQLAAVRRRRDLYGLTYVSMVALSGVAAGYVPDLMVVLLPGLAIVSLVWFFLLADFQALETSRLRALSGIESTLHGLVGSVKEGQDYALLTINAAQAVLPALVTSALVASIVLKFGLEGYQTVGLAGAALVVTGYAHYRLWAVISSSWRPKEGGQQAADSSR